MAHATINDLQAAALGVQLAQAAGLNVEPVGVMETFPITVEIDEVDAVDDPMVSAPPDAREHLAELRQQLRRH